ncbi:phosphotransferase [Pseudoxanthobacter sp.]|uniref:phosphotransferase n=1 Tax=Pseudoxanthobacter sp. TaxID=1925742 RepID=UPI002FE00097
MAVDLDWPHHLLSAAPPAADVADAQRIADTLFGLAVSARPLTSERDRNFHLIDAAGRGFVLKIVNAQEDPAVTDFQTQAFLHVVRRNPALPVARVMPARDGRYEARVELADGSRCQARIVTHLPGEPLARVRASAALRRSIGRSLAELDRALADFEHPGADHPLLWDLKSADALLPLQESIADAGLRARAEAGLQPFLDHVRPAMARLPFQVIHNDFNPHNVLADPAAPEKVTGVIDFGDMVRAPRINDVAVAAAYHVGPAEAALDGVAELVAAYHAVFPLEPQEVELLFDLVMARQVATVTITAWRAARYPDNAAYILRNQPRAVAGLAVLTAIERDRAQAVLRRACAME